MWLFRHLDESFWDFQSSCNIPKFCKCVLWDKIRTQDFWSEDVFLFTHRSRLSRVICIGSSRSWTQMLSKSSLSSCFLHFRAWIKSSSCTSRWRRSSVWRFDDRDAGVTSSSRSSRFRRITSPTRSQRWTSTGEGTAWKRPRVQRSGRRAANGVPFLTTMRNVSG